MSSCSDNLGGKGKSSTEGDVRFGGASASLELWARGPTIDGGDLTLDAKRDLDGVPRTPVPFYDLPDASGDLKGPFFSVFDSESSGQSTSVSDWTNRFVPWRNNTDFKLLMAFSHLSTAKRYVSALFPDVSFNDGGLSIDRVDVFAAEPGSPLNTGYLAGGGRGILEFFSNNNPSIPFTPTDEADAIYHEYGHVLQHALNKGILENAGNFDMDTLLEGLSDVFAAAILRDEHILSYFNANSPYFYTNDRTGPRHTRHLRHSLSFPKSYMAQIHLDGRVVAGAINDIRKLLMGETVALENCTGTCTVRFSSKTLTKDEAWDLALRLSHIPLKRLVQSSTLQRYAERLYEEVSLGADVKQLCANAQSCVDEFKSDVSMVLQSRGLLSWSGFPRFTRTLKLPGASGVTTPEVLVYGYPAFVPLGQELGMADSDHIIEPCESVLVLPNIRNNTDVAGEKAQLYEIDVKLLSVSGFTNIRNSNGQVAEDTTGKTGTNSRTKMLGWLSPSQMSWDLARSTSSTWYRTQPAVGSQMLKFPHINQMPSPLGWAVKAPSSGTVSVRFNVRMRVYNTISNVETLVTNFNVTQSAEIPSGQTSFCGN